MIYLRNGCTLNYLISQDSYRYLVKSVKNNTS